MVHEDQLLSEYLDGELAPDLTRRLEERLQADSALRDRLETLRSQQVRLRQAMNDDNLLPEVRLPAAQERVWEAISQKLARREQPAQPFWRRQIFIPLPVLAALAIAIVGAVGITVALRPTGGPNLADNPASNPATGLVPVSTETAAKSYSLPLKKDSQGMTVTIQVQDLDQLLSILEDNGGIKELTVKLPQNQSFTTYGQPKFMKASER